MDESIVQNLQDMGFPEEEVRIALRAARGNGDLAVEFLMSGIPPHLLGGGSDGGPDSGDPLDMLRRHPQINALRRQVQEDPSSLQSILSQIGAQDPALLEAIHNDRQGFIDLMNEPVDEDADDGMGGMGGMGGGIPPHMLAG